MSQAKSPSGRETSFGLPTSGYKGWIPCRFKAGSCDKNPPKEGWKHCVTNIEYTPPEGWNGEPPSMTGEKIRTPSDSYREGYERIKWHTEPVNPASGS